jgi:hypothetical protein
MHLVNALEGPVPRPGLAGGHAHRSHQRSHRPDHAVADHAIAVPAKNLTQHRPPALDARRGAGLSAALTRRIYNLIERLMERGLLGLDVIWGIRENGTIGLKKIPRLAISAE